MYEDFFGLTERPFTLFPDPDYLYLAPQHKLAQSYLEYGVKQRAGFVVLTGEVGTGKTTLIKSLLRAKAGKEHLGVIYQTSLRAEDLLELLLKEFGVRGHFPTRAARLAAFKQFLLSAYGRGEHVVLVIDEAQNLGPEALEELRLLSNIQAEKEPLLQVILVGQSVLRQRLRHPTMRQLAQRVAVHYHLNPLTLEETKEYVRFRLARAGGRGIFTESALEKLYDYAKGVPRRLNVWCDLALVAGFAEGRQELDGDFLDVVFQAQRGSLVGSEAEEELPPADQGPLAGTMEPPLASDNGLRTLLDELWSRLTRLEDLVLEMTTQLMPALVRALAHPRKVESTQREVGLEPPGEKVVAEAAVGPPEALISMTEGLSEDNGKILKEAQKPLLTDLIHTPESSGARPYQTGELGKALIAAAGGVAVLVLAIILIKPGFWANKIQGISHKIHPATQTTAEPKMDSRHAELEKQVPFALRREATPKGSGKVQPEGSEEQASSTAKSEDLGKPKELSPQLSQSHEPERAPPTSPGPPASAQIPSPPEAKVGPGVAVKEGISAVAEKPITPPGEARPEAPESPQPRAGIPSTKDKLGKPEEISSPLSQTKGPAGAPSPSPAPPAPARTPSPVLTQLTIRTGESLSYIVNQNYAADKKLGLVALILANPEIANEDLIYPGRVLYLPEVNFDKKTIRLKDNLFYAIYRRTISSKDDKESTSWLAKKKLGYVLRDTRDSRGNTVHRVFLGGYETEEELEKALASLKPATE